MLYVSVLILFVMEWLQIKFCVFEYSRKATILQVETFQKQIKERQLIVSKNCSSLNYYLH